MKKRIWGKTSKGLIFSAYVGGNEDIFPKILQLYVPPGSTVADVTYGKGIFWKKAPKRIYQLLATDIKTGVDCRSLPYTDRTIDCVVLDPPCAEGFYRRPVSQLAGSRSHNASGGTCARNTETIEGPKYHVALLDLYDLYFKAGQEAHRALCKDGIFIVKCQDLVSDNRQRFIHADLINYYQSLGFYAKDLFLAVGPNKPRINRGKKLDHARKNHSYFLVFIKES